MQIPDQLKSRKFWLAVTAGTVAFANGMYELGLTNEQVWQVVAPILTFITAEGAADAVQRHSGR